MANEDGLLREVDQDLAEERQWMLIRQYVPAFIGAGAALVLGVGAYQIWNGIADQKSGAQAVALKNAAETYDVDPVAGEEALRAVAEDAPAGYEALAQFRIASARIADSDSDGAIAALQDVYSSGALPGSMRNYARIRAAYLALDQGRDAVLVHLGDLETQEGSFQFFAREVMAIAALLDQDYQTALNAFEALQNEFSAPGPVQARAKEFSALARAGKAGVNLTGEIELDDILGVLGDVDSEADAEDGLSALQDALNAATEELSENDVAESGENVEPDGEPSDATSDESD